MKKLSLLAIAILISICSDAAIGPITGTNSVCVGAATTLSNATSGGAWSCASVIAVVDATTGVVTGTSAGTATVSYSVGADVAMTVVTVSPDPGSIMNGSTPFCAGSTAYMYTYVSGGTWTSSNPAVCTFTSGGNFTSSIAGTSTVTYSLSAGCSVSKVITVNPLPAPITGPHGVCVGSSITLSNTTPGGMWFCETWLGTMGLYTGIMTGTAPGTANVVYSAPTGCQTATTVGIASASATITGGTSLCLGVPATLSFPAPGGTWTSDAPLIANIDPATGIVNGLLPGSAAITYTTPGCAPLTTTVTIASVLPAITGFAGVCTYQPATLSNAMGGGTWSSSNTSIASVGSTTGIVTSVSAGTAVITYSTASCGTATRIVTVVGVVPNITASASYICGGSTITLSNSMPGGTWSSNFPATATIDSITGIVTPVAPGTAYFRYTVTGCQNATNIRVYSMSTPELVGCNNVRAGDTIKFYHPQYSIWTSSNTSVATVNSTGRVTGVSAGTAIITNYSGYVGCIQGIKTVSVTPTSLIKPVTGYNLICANGGTTLTDAISGGVWSCSPSSVMTIGASTGAVTGVSGGQGTITYTVGAASCTSDFYVNAVPPPISGSSSVCLHETVTLTSSFSIDPRWWIPGTNYSPANECTPDIYFTWGYPPPLIFDCGYMSWGASFSSSDPTVATVSYNGAVVGIAAGSTTISYTDEKTHCVVTTPFTVNPLSVGPITGSLSTCIASTTTLSNSVSGGTWTSSNTSIATVGSTTGVVNGIAAGTANITYDNGGTCGKIVAQVTVSPAPGAVAGSPASMCVGSTATLSNSVAGGTWSSSAPSVASVVVSTGVITAAGTGTAVITYTLGPCGNYVTTTINVSASFPIAGVANICSGSTTTFTNPGGTGTWTSGATAIATVGTAGIVTGVSDGTATITFTSVTCGSVTRTVTVYPVSPITGPSSVCLGSPAIMGNPIPGGTWSNMYTTATIDATGTVTGVYAGISPITYTLPTGCRAFRTVTISAVPATYTVTGGGSYCSGGTGVMIGLSGSAPGVSYQLYSGAVAVGPPVSGTYGALSFGLLTVTGSYYVVATSATTGCSAVMTGTVTVSTVSSVPPITGTPTVCIGITPTLLSNTMVGGTWSSSNTAVASVSPGYGYVYGLVPGTSTISYTTASCGTATVVVTVSSPPPAITGATAVCQGQTTPLSIAATGGTWSSSNTAAATITSTGVVTGVSYGYSNVSYTAATGCYSIKGMNVNILPVITGSPALCVGGTAALSTTGYAGTWSSSASAIVPVTSGGYITGAAPGTATITYTGTGGCIGTYTVGVTSACTGMPTAGTASADIGVICSVAPVALSLTGYTVACGISYQWQSSPNGTTWTNISGVTNTTATVYPYSTTSYRCAVTCASGGLTAYSSATTVAVAYAITSHSVVPGPDTACHNAHFRLNVCSYASTLNVTTHYGDGTFDNVPLGYTGGYGVDVFHNYTLPGAYTIKQVLYDGTTALDSVTYSYEHLFCRTLPVKFYQDFNTNCAFDAGDNYNMTPVTVAIDSNGVTIDTMVVTSGMYRKAYGPPGTVYAFRVIAVSGGRIVGCPSSGVLYDTISASVYTYPAKYFGLQCGTSTNFDLAETVSAFSGTTFATSTIYITNSYCSPASPVVTMHMSPRYHYFSATPAPASVSGNTITWNLPPVSSAGTSVRMISVVFVPTVSVMPGDTIHSDYLVTPLTGDVNTANNYIAIVNTVVTSYDPNDIEVAPAGKVLPCAQLQYSVRFENTGNDTARNIYVLDTLSPNLDPTSLNVVMASATMNVSVINDGVRNIARFDFPNINLPDSSHHNQNKGMFVFSIKARSGLAFGTTINNGVGIYFDNNEVVNTNTVTNTIGMDTIAGPTTMCSGSTITLTNATTGGVWSVVGSAATVSGGVVSGLSSGTVTVSYTITNSCGAFVATKVVTVTASPASLAISGTPTVCTGAETTLSTSVPGGSWTSSNSAIAGVGTTGVVSGVATGTATISYAVANSCGSTTATKIVTVNVSPSVASITGPASGCLGATSSLTNVTSGGLWTSSNTAIASVSAAGVVSGLSAGTTTISYSIINSCGTAAATRVFTVDVLPAVASIGGTALVCPGGTATLTCATPGGTWSSSYTGVATVSAGGVVSGVSTGIIAISYTISSSCGSTAASRLVTVSATASTPVTGSMSVCTGSVTTLSTSVSGGTWTSGNTAVATIAPSTGITTGVATGTAMITYTHTNGCRSTAVTTVNVAPDPISGPSFACTGVSVSLSNLTAGGTWSSGSTTIATIGSTSGIVTGLATGTATMSYTMPGGCASTTVISVATSVMPAASVTLSPGGPLCQGATVAFTAATTYGGSAPALTWFVNGAVVGSGSTYSYIPAPSDNVLCRLVSNMQCRMADTVYSASASMTVYPLYNPVVTISTNPGLYVFPGQAVTLSALTVDAGPAPQYQWYLNGAEISGATSVSYTSSAYADKDSITCRVTGTAGCGTAGYKSVVMHVFPTSVGNTGHKDGVTIYPNPSNGSLVVHGDVPGMNEEVVIEISNVLGQVIYRKPVVISNGVLDENVQLSNTLANGMYMLNLKTSAENKVFHFVLEK